MAFVKVINNYKEWASLSYQVAKRLEQNPSPFQVNIGDVQRTIDQNSYQHVLYQRIADFAKEAGNNWSIDDAKDFCKREFGYTEGYNDLKGRPQTRLMSTKKYGKERTSDYIQAIIAHFAGFGLDLPQPDNKEPV